MIKNFFIITVVILVFISYFLSENNIDCNNSDVSQKECLAIVNFANFAGYKIKHEKNQICEMFNGIFCEKIDGKNYITEISLRMSNLNGNLNNSISSLTKLERLYISENNLSGKLPDLSNLKDLHTLYIDDKQLSRNIIKIPNLKKSNFNFKVFTNKRKCNCKKNESCVIWNSIENKNNFNFKKIKKNKPYCLKWGVIHLDPLLKENKKIIISF